MYRACYKVGMSNSRTFAVVLEPEEEGVTYGKDEGEALAQDAIGLVIADSVARGEARL